MVSFILLILLIFINRSHGEIGISMDDSTVSKDEVHKETWPNPAFEGDSWFIRWHPNTKEALLKSPDAIVVPMVTTNKEHYSCSISMRPTRDVIGEYSAHASPWRQLRQLHSDTSCIYRIESYWMYELCHGQHVRQVHTEKSGSKDSRLEYYLGRYSSEHLQRDELAYDDLVRADSDFRPSKMKVADTWYPYFEVVYDGGTVCDLTGEHRIARVRYVCDETLSGHQMSDIVEIASCQYQILVMSPKLCNLPAYRAETKVAGPIDCVAAESSKLPYPRSLLKLETSALQQRSHALLNLIDDLNSSSPELSASVLSVEKALKPLKSFIDELASSVVSDGTGSHKSHTDSGADSSALTGAGSGTFGAEQTEQGAGSTGTESASNTVNHKSGAESASVTVRQKSTAEPASATVHQKSSAESASASIRQKSGAETASALVRQKSSAGFASATVRQKSSAESASAPVRQKSIAKSASAPVRQKSSAESASAADLELVEAILSGKHCLYTQNGKRKVEFCYGLHVKEYCGTREIRTLGVFDRPAHLEWFNSLKPSPLSEALEWDPASGRRREVSHLYTQGSSCSSNGVTKLLQVQVAFKCISFSIQEEPVELTLLDLRDCKYYLIVGGSLLCSSIADADGSTGLLRIPSQSRP